MLRALALFVLVLSAVPAAAQEYQSKELAEAGTAYRQELIDRIPANKRQPSLIARLRSDADAEYRAKRYAQAMTTTSASMNAPGLPSCCSQARAKRENSRWSPSGCVSGEFATRSVGSGQAER